MQHRYLPLFLLLPLSMASQTIRGIVYDDEATVKGVKIVNTTKNILTYSGADGTFSIEAQVNDSIVFGSLFHEAHTLVPKQADFDEVIVVALTKQVNVLGEVQIQNAPEFKAFDAAESNAILQNQIQEDIKRNPHLYGKSSSGGGNILGVLGLVAKLFKSKKIKVAPPTYASYDDLVLLFETDTYFNQAFLERELHIAEDHTFLFLQYCEAQQIASQWLLPENQMYLLDTLLKCGKAFRANLKAEKD